MGLLLGLALFVLFDLSLVLLVHFVDLLAESGITESLIGLDDFLIMTAHEIPNSVIQSEIALIGVLGDYLSLTNIQTIASTVVGIVAKDLKQVTTYRPHF